MTPRPRTLASEEDEKIMTVLEFYLSLHEADEVFYRIFDKGTNKYGILKILNDYRIANKDD